MRLSFVIPTLLGMVSLFFISAGVGLRTLYSYAPLLGYMLGIIFFLFAGKATSVLRKREEKKEKEMENRYG
ncbi:hypothetical protein [Cytobacillus firmus]|uniref:Uncharacterized protein n=1 Tax=Cytobacillus firmus TaxID=1399 RepID=A0AA46SMA6_CYTFI|nr:hypothetical protein [Cytobacillus firmus]UYG98180.1 hypothetical protein OD459_27255 [Cytobacillus firmus]